MPVNRKAMANMKKEYGDEKGERVYYASVNKGSVKESLEEARRTREGLIRNFASRLARRGGKG